MPRPPRRPLPLLLIIFSVLLLSVTFRLGMAHRHHGEEEDDNDDEHDEQDEDEDDSSCKEKPGSRVIAEFQQGLVTVDGRGDEWANVDGLQLALLPALDFDEDKAYSGGNMTIKAVHDGRNILFMLKVDGDYAYSSSDDHKCPSVALMFQVGENATYQNMGGCSHLPGKCTDKHCRGHEVDIMHFSSGNAIPGRLYGSNLVDNRKGNGNDSFGHLIDAYGWNPHCLYLDGIGPSGNTSSAQNDWIGAWWHNSLTSQPDLPPHQALGMPSLSPTMTEGNIARWLKKEGDKVLPGEVLCEVETDKATVEMECMEEGYIAKIIHGDGSKDIKVGEIIAIVVEEEGDTEKFKDYKVSESAGSAEVKMPNKPSQSRKEEEATVKSGEPQVVKTEEVSHSHSHSEDRIFCSPLARKLAEDNNVPLSSIKGTGPDGRILKADIEDYLASRKKDLPAQVKIKESAAAQALGYVDIPNSQIRKVTASRLLLSKQTIPHYYLTVDTRVDKLIELRKELNSVQEASGGKRLSINDLVIKAAALALRKVPHCNSSWMNDFIRQYNNVNINVAVQTDNGLFVPVIKDADKKGLSTIAEEVKILAHKAKENILKPEDYEGGTFTVSNLGGPFGIKQFCAIINPPQSAILAVGSAEKRVLPGGGPDQFEFGSFMSVTLSCDHRVIDGAIGAEWLKAFKSYIEKPHSMLL